MSAIPPPPVGADVEPSVVSDNRNAFRTLRKARIVEPSPLAPLRRPRAFSVLALAAFGAATLIAATAGARVNMRSRNRAWYRLLRKPSFTPPQQVFGLVWTPLYALSAYSGWRVWRKPESRARSAALGLWGAQMAFNGAWSWIFFGQHRPRLALADLAANQLSLAAYAATAARVDRPAAFLVAPYLGWLTFAGALNAGIIRKNAWVLRG